MPQSPTAKTIFSRRGMVLLAAAVAFAFQGSRGLYETTEGRYAECAREMMQASRYLQPTLDEKPHWTKPPLSYWAIIAGMKLLGTNEWGVRLYNAVAFCLTVLVVAQAGTVLWNLPTGLLAGLIYATSPLPAFAANAVSTDTLLTLWEALAVLFYLKARTSQLRRHRQVHIILMWLFFGLGFLTKGPVALLPLVPIIIWHLTQRKTAASQPRLFEPAGVVVFAAAGLWWYVLIELRHPGLLWHLLKDELLVKFTASGTHGPQWYKPFEVYLPLLFVGTGPWIYFGLRTIRRERLLAPKHLWQRLRAGGKGAFLLWWVLIPLVVFFAVRNRMPLYILPLCIPLALAIARGIGKEQPSEPAVRRIPALVLATAAVMIAAKALLPYYPSQKNMKHLHAMCSAAAPEQARIVAFREPKLFGLQFYLGGRLERISFHAGKRWADATAASFVERMKTLPTTERRKIVFVTKPREENRLREIITRHGLRPVKLGGDKFWSILTATEPAQNQSAKR